MKDDEHTDQGDCVMADIGVYFAKASRAFTPVIDNLSLGALMTTALAIGLEVAKHHPRTAQKIYEAVAAPCIDDAGAELDAWLLRLGGSCAGDSPPTGLQS